jgi:hypothetical protein
MEQRGSKMAKKERMYFSIDKDIANILKSLDRNRSKAVNIILRYAKERGILQKVVQHLQGEESLLKELLEEKEENKEILKDKKGFKKSFSNLVDGIDQT